MLPKNCGRLLYNAVRETLETMAFADVVPCSIKVAGEEFAQDADFFTAADTSIHSISGWGSEDEGAAADPWGTETTAEPDPWGTPESAAEISTPEPPAVEAVETAEESWGDSPDPTPATPPASTASSPEVPMPEATDDADWGDVAPAGDPWGESPLGGDPCGGAGDFNTDFSRPDETSFDTMAAAETNWHWACMKVNSPDVHSVWFIVPHSLANALMENMYAGEDVHANPSIVRDLIAELTNVLGGRLMLLLEELGGKFTLTVPEIGTGMPDISEAYSAQGIVCKVTVDGEHPTIVTLCFNQGGVFAKK